MIGSFHWSTNENRTKDLIVANQHTEKIQFLAQKNFHSKVFFSKISQKRPKNLKLEKIQPCQLTQKYISNL